MIFFDLDNTLLDHDGAEQDAIRDFAKRYRDEIIDCPEGIEVMWRAITDEKRQQWRAGKLNFEGCAGRGSVPCFAVRSVKSWQII